MQSPVIRKRILCLIKLSSLRGFVETDIVVLFQDSSSAGEEISKMGKRQIQLAFFETACTGNFVCAGQWW